MVSSYILVAEFNLLYRNVSIEYSLIMPITAGWVSSINISSVNGYLYSFSEIPFNLNKDFNIELNYSMT